MPEPSGTVAVTGAAGFVGSHICRALLSQGAEVRAISRTGSARTVPTDIANDVEIADADVRDVSSLTRAFQGCLTVVNSAGLVVFEKAMGAAAQSVNHGGSRNVVEACRDVGVKKLVHISSIHAFGPLKNRTLDDSTPLHVDSRSIYAASKAAGHRDLLAMAAEYGIDASTVCPSGVIGPLDAAPSSVGGMILAIAGRKLPMLIREGYWWCDVRDVASATAAAVGIESGSRVYLLGGIYATLPDLAEMCSDASGRKVTRAAVPLWLAAAGLPLIKFAAKLRNDVPLFSSESIDLVKDCPSDIDISPAMRELGYSPRPLADTIGDALSWSIDNGMLVR